MGNSGISDVLASIARDLSEGRTVSPVDLFTVHTLQFMWGRTPESLLGRDTDALRRYNDIFSNEPLAKLLDEALIARVEFWYRPYTKDLGVVAGTHVSPQEHFLIKCSNESVVTFLKSDPDFFARADRTILARLRKERSLRGKGWFGEKTRQLLLEINVVFRRNVVAVLTR